MSIGYDVMSMPTVPISGGTPAGLAQKYDEFYGEASVRHDDIQLSGWPTNRIQAILANAEMSGDTIMDVGCGSGNLLYQFRQRFSRLVGLEYSPARLRQAEASLQGFNFRGICASAENIDAISSNSIDVIVSADVIEHIPDVYAAAAELFRVLKPGGKLIINTPNIAFAVKRWRLLAGRFPSTSQPNEGLGSDVLFDGGHLHYFTYRSLRLVLERAGFVMERKTGFGRFGKLHDVWPELTSVGVQWTAVKPASMG